MKATVYRDAAGDWRWRIVAYNGNILADSGQGYSRRIDCIVGLETVTGAVMDRTRQSMTPIPLRNSIALEILR